MGDHDDPEVEDRSGWTAREQWEAPFGEADRRGLLEDAPPEAISKREDGMYVLDLDVLLAAGWELSDDGGLAPPKGMPTPKVDAYIAELKSNHPEQPPHLDQTQVWVHIDEDGTPHINRVEVETTYNGGGGAGPITRVDNTVSGSSRDGPTAYVLSVNIHRRHITARQRAMAVAQVRFVSKQDMREANACTPTAPAAPMRCSSSAMRCCATPTPATLGTRFG